jgi:hypothetical protein
MKRKTRAQNRADKTRKALDTVYSDPRNQPSPGYMAGLKRVQARAIRTQTIKEVIVATKIHRKAIHGMVLEHTGLNTRMSNTLIDLDQGMAISIDKLERFISSAGN